MKTLLAAALAVCLSSVAAAPALATGGDAPGEMQEALASAPARVLAQQALATLDVTGDVMKARERIDAALVSKDRADVDVALLRAADEALDGGDREQAVALLNRSLGGGPAPADDAADGDALSDQALHNAGRAYEPNETAQEIVAFVSGLALLAVAALLLLATRRRRRATS